jgi:anti-sigma B factor antagonist
MMNDRRNSSMRFEERKIDKVIVTKILDNRVTADVSAHLKEQILKCVNQGYILIVIDLSEVTFIDSSGLGALISSLKTVGQAGTLAISGTRSSVMTTFKLTRMDRVFRMYNTTAEALQALSADN